VFPSEQDICDDSLFCLWKVAGEVAGAWLFVVVSRVVPDRLSCNRLKFASVISNTDGWVAVMLEMIEHVKMMRDTASIVNYYNETTHWVQL
jgi:hypothetical protein